MPLTLDLQIRRHPDGEFVLHFPFVTFSDIHLGTKHANATQASLVLQYTTSDTLFLVGDIIDGWVMSHSGSWDFPESHKQVLAHIFRKANQGTDVIYIPGNHDEVFRGKEILSEAMQPLSYRKLTGKNLHGVRVEEEAEYLDPQGRKHTFKTSEF